MEEVKSINSQITNFARPPSLRNLDPSVGDLKIYSRQMTC